MKKLAEKKARFLKFPFIQKQCIDIIKLQGNINLNDKTTRKENINFTGKY